MIYKYKIIILLKNKKLNLLKELRDYLLSLKD